MVRERAADILDFQDVRVDRKGFSDPQDRAVQISLITEGLVATETLMMDYSCHVVIQDCLRKLEYCDKVLYFL